MSVLLNMLGPFLGGSWGFLGMGLHQLFPPTLGHHEISSSMAWPMATTIFLGPFGATR